MKRVLAASIALALLAVPAVSAGSASKPEVEDPSGDDVSSLPLLGAKSVDLTKAWIDQETPDSFVFILDAGDDFAPDPTETLAYEWTLDVAGATYVFGADVWNGGASTTTTPTGIASDAHHNGAGLMTIVVPRTEFAGIEPGQFMSNIVVTTEAYVGSPAIWSDSDEGVGERSYTIGSQADPSMDFDGDGHPDAVEIAQGTDPTDPEDPPAFIPPTETVDLGEQGGSYTLEAPSPVTESYVHTWTSALTLANSTVSATVAEGTATLTIADELGGSATIDVAEDGVLALDASNLTAGNWTLTVATSEFSGTLSLSIAAADDAAPVDGVDEETHDDHEDDGETAPTDSHDEPAKKTPMPALLPVALGAALALRRQRE